MTFFKIAHRINTSEQWAGQPQEYGAEIDVRYHENSLILHHDPFSHHQDPKPERLAHFLEHYNGQGPLILNVKTEGIERQCCELMQKYQIENWFFLDLSMPYFVRYSLLAKAGDIPGFSPENLAVRFSEYEPIEYALSFKGVAAWVWVDCFTKLPLNESTYSSLKQAGFKICIVSPELQGHSIDLISSFKTQLQPFLIDAVCTKRPDLW